MSNHEHTENTDTSAAHCDTCSVSEEDASTTWLNTKTLMRTMTPVSGMLLGLGLLSAFSFEQEQWSILFYLLSIASGGVFVLISAIRGLVKQRFLNISFLVTIASVGAIYIGQYGEAAAVVFLFALAEFFESYGVEQSRKAVAALLKRSPKVARKLDGQMVPVEEVRVGEVVAVRPGEQIPLDGIVKKGSTSVDESAITGESAPDDKKEGDAVYAGTMNIQGYLEIEVTKESKDSTFAQIIALIQKAQASKAPTQAFIDTFAKYYTPAVVLTSILMVVVPVLFLGLPFEVWLYRALILLVVACPCALVIATPVAVASAIGGGSRHGILIKGGKYLEKLASIRALAFDKTRTLTYGRHTVTDVITLGEHTKEELLADAAGVEQFSSHPLAEAIVSYAQQEGVTPHDMESYQDSAGKGGAARCLVCNADHYIGNTKLMADNHIDSQQYASEVERLEKEGKTVVLVADQEKLIGLIAITDEIRPEAKEVVSELKRMGIRSSILTGDNAFSAAYVARVVGIEDVFASLLPEQKVSQVQKLKQRYGSVAMMGDGVNDAPSLVTADIGFSMGDGGTDVAIESSDVTFLTGDLRSVPKAIRLGKRAMRIIHTNIVLALGIKVVFIALAPFGLTNLVFAIAADSGMAIVVILNSLRLFKIK